MHNVFSYYVQIFSLVVAAKLQIITRDLYVESLFSAIEYDL